jgi:LysR family glycine cleavage system transcriptional activator
MLETARVKAFRDWVFAEVGRFKLLFDRACEAGSAASAVRAADAADALRVAL